ncbi:MAG: hypothetical protein R3F13_04640 [Prosthecobacter sp.]
MIPQLGRVGIVLLVCLSLGLHRGVVQSVAWTQMLVRYASENSLLDAVKMTFDGMHPCPLCEAVEDDRETERRQSSESPQQDKKMFAVLVALPVLEAPPATSGFFPAVSLLAVPAPGEPETPPPRRG